MAIDGVPCPLIGSTIPLRVIRQRFMKNGALRNDAWNALLPQRSCGFRLSTFKHYDDLPLEEIQRNWNLFSTGDKDRCAGVLPIDLNNEFSVGGFPTGGDNPEAAVSLNAHHFDVFLPPEETVKQSVKEFWRENKEELLLAFIRLE